MHVGIMSSKFTTILVQCSVHAISVVRNGELIGKTTFYNYTDTVTYECDAGFEKNTTKPVRCESDRSWSAVPRCVRGERERLKDCQ